MKISIKKSLDLFEFAEHLMSCEGNGRTPFDGCIHFLWHLDTRRDIG